jgi:hypothetical protein
MGLEKINFRLAYDFCSRVQDAVFNAEGLDDDSPTWHLPDDDIFLAKALKPAKVTLLHDYIYEIGVSGIDYELDKGAPEHFPESFTPLLKAASVDLPPWLNPRDVADHLDELDRLCRDAVTTLVPGAFHLLYSDLNFLHAFQAAVSQKLKSFQRADYPEVLRSDGIIAKRPYWPEWLISGVFHRDKGRCQNCYKDLTGVTNLGAKIHLDHIMPLALGGSNDPTNVQLLCSECNSRKGGKDVEGNWHTETYW